MDIQQLKAMLSRRGYTLERDENTNYSYPPGVLTRRTSLYGVAGERRTILMAEDSLHAMNMEEARQCIDAQLGWGRCHHMWHFCGFPLLREVKNAGSRETLAYRAVSDGPTGKSLLECPQCLQYVQDNSVEEIED